MAKGWASMLRSGSKMHRHRWHRCVPRVGSVILNPQNSGNMAGLASRAAHTDARVIFLSSSWTIGA